MSARDAIASVFGSHFAAGSTADAILAALDAPDTADETVTLAVWRDPEDGDVRMVMPSGDADADYRRMAWSNLGTVTLPLDRERGE